MKFGTQILPLFNFYIKRSRLNLQFFPVFEWSGPMEIRLHRNHLKYDLQKSGFQMVPDFQSSISGPHCIKIPTLSVYGLCHQCDQLLERVN